MKWFPAAEEGGTVRVTKAARAVGKAPGEMVSRTGGTPAGDKAAKKRQPNELLEAARRRMKSPRRPGEELSRPEATDLANAYIKKHFGASSPHIMGDHVLGRLERGVVGAPHPVRQEALRAIYGVRSNSELGFRPRRADVAAALESEVSTTRAAESVFSGSEGVDDDSLMASAAGAASIAGMTEARTVPPSTLLLYQAQLAQLCGDFVHKPIGKLFPELNALAIRLTGHIRAGVRLHQGRDVYLLAGLTCAVLAHANHVLGQSRAGLVHTETARYCALEAGHPDLLAWSLGTEALLHESVFGAQSALEKLAEAQDVRRPCRESETVTARLACYEARFSARAGQHDRAIAAMRRCAEVSDADGDRSDLDQIGGILTFPMAKRDFFIASAYAQTGHHSKAAHHADLSITGYLTGPAEQLSYGDVALARLTLAQARLQSGAVDGVADALEPVLALPRELRITPLADPLTALSKALSAPPYLGSPAASDIVNSIDRFTGKKKGIMSG